MKKSLQNQLSLVPHQNQIVNYILVTAKLLLFISASLSIILDLAICVLIMRILKQKTRYTLKPSKTKLIRQFQTFQITYSSDNFDKLYILAENLIKRDSAYVCHCTGRDI